MEYFFNTVENMKKGHGFAHFDATHIMWLVIFAVCAVLVSILYKKSDEKTKRNIRYIIAILLVADEIFKVVCLCMHGNYIPKYLPLQLCSINIFIILRHAIRPSKFVGNFLYTICLPAAMAALLFPTWVKLPLANFMHIHSFTVHILLALYPIILTVAGEVTPKIKELPKMFLVLAVFVAVAFGANKIFDTNFMFLKSASKGNPLYFFEKKFGNHLIGYPVLITAVLAVMHGVPWAFCKVKEKIKGNSEK